MRIDELHRYLDDLVAAEPFLRSLGLEHPRRGHSNLVRLAHSGVTLDLLADLCDQLAHELPGSSDPDMALNNLERFFAASRNPLGLATLFERDRLALPTLLQMLATSQHLADLLVIDTEAYDLVRITEGQPVARQTLVDEVIAEVDVVSDDRAVMSALRRFKRRDTLRIAYGDIIRGQSLETVTTQISYLADALLEGAVRAAWRKLIESRGRPVAVSGRQARFVVLGLGKLGGNELNYSSDIDLIFLYDSDGMTDGRRPISNHEFFDRLAREVVKLLTEQTELGIAYRVDLRLRPEGQRGPTVQSLESTLHYYDVLGRTWERQAFVKARPVAGNLDLGIEFLAQMEPWIYRRYLSRADITGIRALKRRIEQRTIREGADALDVKTGHGGIRDVEFVLQFLQLLNGGDLPVLRTGNTLGALAALEQVGCLTNQERTLLEENYRFLRKIEHRLQIMFDLQTHLMPETPDEMRKLAIRMGYVDAPRGVALEAFELEYRQRTDVNRRILDHLLLDAFGRDDQPEPEVDLVLDPDPLPETIRDVMSRHGFRDVEQAYQNLMALSQEKVRFLSTRRCRHFLAAIAPRLLATIGATPDPDSTLVNLEKVSDSLGGKGVLWELFSFNPPTLHLYVELCATSPFLSGLLISHPGMLDELMDSLVLNKLPSQQVLRDTLAELCHAAEDLEPILHSFKNSQILRIGVRNILGKEDIQATCGALSDVAQVCLEQITRVEYERLVEKLGQPTLELPPPPEFPDQRTGTLETQTIRLPGVAGPHGPPCQLVVLALGKFGGRELNYHSDLDLVFLYDDDGPTIPLRRSKRAEGTTNQHFFSELGTRIIKVASHLGPYGRLYEVDPRLRPTGRSGALATSLVEFARYYGEGHGQLWERQALCRARVVYGEPEAAQRVMQAVAEAAFHHSFSKADVRGIRDMRTRLEETASRQNIKRGPGGLVDIEFLVQMLQLKYGWENPHVRHANTLSALAALRDAGYLESDDAEFFAESYRTLRTVEAALRLMNATARDNLPDNPSETDKLARHLGLDSGTALLENCRRYTAETRQRFQHLVEAAMQEG